MNYKAAYLHLFNRVTDIVVLLAEQDGLHEQINLLHLLQAIQIEAEDICIGE